MKVTSVTSVDSRSSDSESVRGRERLQVVADPLVGVVGEAVAFDPVERAVVEPLFEISCR